jgi:hypothetical protein
MRGGGDNEAAVRPPGLKEGGFPGRRHGSQDPPLQQPDWGSVF